MNHDSIQRGIDWNVRIRVNKSFKKENIIEHFAQELTVPAWLWDVTQPKLHTSLLHSDPNIFTYFWGIWGSIAFLCHNQLYPFKTPFYSKDNLTKMHIWGKNNTQCH